MSSTADGSHMVHNNSGHQTVNESFSERLVMAIGGGALAAYGLSRHSPGGMVLTLLGAGLLHQGVTGHCELYHALGLNRANTAHRDSVARDVHVEEKVIINLQPEVVYQFWLEFENFPRFMRHLESVTRIGQNNWRWIAKGPAGLQVQWDAEIYNEKENELISWRSLPNSEFVNAGTVTFEPSPDGRGTIVSVVMNYNVPGGKITGALAHLLRMAPEQLLEEDLQRLKQLLETGEIVSDENQFSGSITEGESPLDLESSGSRGADESGRSRGGTMMGRAHSQL